MTIQREFNGWKKGDDWLAMNERILPTFATFFLKMQCRMCKS